MKFRAWAPALLWMLVIFVGSTDVLSNQHTSRFLGPLLHWLRPGLSDRTVEQTQFLLRKAGHLTEYAVLALLLRRALAGAPHPIRGGHVRSYAAALALSVIFAISDEFHQSFVPTREASALDVGIDSLGATIGLCSAWLTVTHPWKRQPA